QRSQHRRWSRSPTWFSGSITSSSRPSASKTFSSPEAERRSWNRVRPGMRRGGVAGKTSSTISLAEKVRRWPSFSAIYLRSWQLGHEVGHLQGGNGGLGALVAGLAAGPVERLLEGVGRQHAEDHRHSGGRGCLRQPARYHRGHVIVMTGVATDHGAEGHDRAVLPARRQPGGDDRDLDSPGHRGHVESIERHAVPYEGRDRALLKPLSDEFVEAAHDEGEAVIAGLQLAAQVVHRKLSI